MNTFVTALVVAAFTSPAWGLFGVLPALTWHKNRRLRNGGAP